MRRYHKSSGSDVHVASTLVAASSPRLCFCEGVESVAQGKSSVYWRDLPSESSVWGTSRLGCLGWVKSAFVYHPPR